MKITPVASTIGAEISDVDLTDLSDADLVDVQCALLAHKVVFFREQTLVRGLLDGVTDRFVVLCDVDAPGLTTPLGQPSCRSG